MSYRRIRERKQNLYKSSHFPFRERTYFLSTTLQQFLLGTPSFLEQPFSPLDICLIEGKSFTKKWKLRVILLVLHQSKKLESTGKHWKYWNRVFFQLSNTSASAPQEIPGTPSSVMNERRKAACSRGFRGYSYNHDPSHIPIPVLRQPVSRTEPDYICHRLNEHIFANCKSKHLKTIKGIS